MAKSLDSNPPENRRAIMNNPLVTIIIPSYNYAHFITETLNNVLEQTYPNWECIIVDDGSTDNTEEVVAQFLAKHPINNFKYSKIANGGIGVARTEGIRLSSGKYFQFLDADDLLSPDKLKVQVKYLEETDAALVFSASRFFRMINGKQVDQVRYPEGFLSLESLKGFTLFQKLVEHNVFTVCSALIRRDLFDIVDGFEAEILNNEDWMLWFKMALRNAFFIFDGDQSSYVLIRLHGTSVMTQHGIMFKSEIQVREKMDELLQKVFMPGKEQLIKRNKDLLALHHLRSVKIGTGLSHVLKSFISSPFSDYKLLCMGGYKLMVRAYKTILR